MLNNFVGHFLNVVFMFSFVQVSVIFVPKSNNESNVVNHHYFDRMILTEFTIVLLLGRDQN